ncbi:MAG: hypothetical protein WC445_02145 [Patescibacteria group bacterium]
MPKFWQVARRQVPTIAGVPCVTRKGSSVTLASQPGGSVSWTLVALCLAMASVMGNPSGLVNRNASLTMSMSSGVFGSDDGRRIVRRYSLGVSGRADWAIKYLLFLASSWHCFFILSRAGTMVFW